MSWLTQQRDAGGDRKDVRPRDRSPRERSPRRGDSPPRRRSRYAPTDELSDRLLVRVSASGYGGGAATAGLGTNMASLPGERLGSGPWGSVSTNSNNTPAIPSSFGPIPIEHSAYDENADPNGPDPATATHYIQVSDDLDCELVNRAGQGVTDATNIRGVYHMHEHLLYVSTPTSYRVDKKTNVQNAWSLTALAMYIKQHTPGHGENGLPGMDSELLDIGCIMRRYRRMGILTSIESVVPNVPNRALGLVIFGRAKIANIWCNTPMSFLDAAHLFIVWKWVTEPVDEDSVDPIRGLSMRARRQRAKYCFQPFAVCTENYTDMDMWKTYNRDPIYGTEQRMGAYEYIGRVTFTDVTETRIPEATVNRFLRPNNITSTAQQDSLITTGNQLPRIQITYSGGLDSIGSVRY